MEKNPKAVMYYFRCKILSKSIAYRNGKPPSSISPIYIKTKITQKVIDGLNVLDFFQSCQIDILKFTKKVRRSQLFKKHYKPTK